MRESAHGGGPCHGDEAPSITASPIPSVSSSLVGKGNAAELSQQSAGSSLRSGFATYYLIVGGDVDTLENKFSKTLDAEMTPKLFLWKKGICTDTYLITFLLAK